MGWCGDPANRHQGGYDAQAIETIMAKRAAIAEDAALLIERYRQPGQPRQAAIRLAAESMGRSVRQFERYIAWARDAGIPIPGDDHDSPMALLPGRGPR